MAAEDQAQENQAQGDATVQRLSKTRRPVIQMVASAVFGAVMGATAAGMIAENLPKKVQAPAFISLPVLLAPTLSATWYWFFIVRPERIMQKLAGEEILQGDTEDDELLDQQELADDELNEGEPDRNDSDRNKLDVDDPAEDGSDETEPRP